MACHLVAYVAIDAYRLEAQALVQCDARGVIIMSTRGMLMESI